MPNGRRALQFASNQASPRLSATLIVRDESAVIEDCLRSLADRVDEIVLVDTGSRDDTVEKARSFPVSLYHFAWTDDFSAARNYAIARATGDWILYIDADERLIVPAGEPLDVLVSDQTKAAWKLRLHPRVGWTAYAELRLFRNDPRIRFRGVIHERVQEDVNSVCRSDGLAIGLSSIALQHVGYEGDQRHKLGRNIPLLRAYLEHEPDRLYCWWHLGEMLELSGEPSAAMEAWHTGIAVSRGQQVHDQSSFLLYFSLIKLQHDRGMPVGDLLAEALTLFPGNLLLQWIASKLAIEAGDENAACATLERLVTIDPEHLFDPLVAYDKTLFTHASREALALCHFRARRYDEAARWYRLAAQAASDPAACIAKALLAESRAKARPEAL
jgi:hypothetical protein